jgi:hypothetical protein
MNTSPFANRTLLSAVFTAHAAAMLVYIFLAPAKGDEPFVYLPVVHASIEAWPLLNLDDVGYGISPIWTWLVGMLGQIFPPLVAGRLLSVLSWVGVFAILATQRGKESRLNLALFVFLPTCFVFAMRCHPLWLGLFLVASAIFVLSRSRAAYFGLLFGAVSAQTFMIFSVAAGMFREYLDFKKSWVKILAVVAVITLAVISNWVLYGGQYPEAFKASDYYLPYRTFDGFTESYFPLHLGLAGWFSLVFTSGGSLTRYLRPVTCVTAIIVLMVIFTDTPIGPVFTAFGRLGEYGELLAKLLIVSGGILLLRHDFHLLGLALVSALALSMLPFLYERYSWFVILGIFIGRHLADPEFNFNLNGKALRWCVPAIAFTAAWTFVFVGSL